MRRIDVAEPDQIAFGGKLLTSTRCNPCCVSIPKLQAGDVTESATDPICLRANEKTNHILKAKCLGRPQLEKQTCRPKRGASCTSPTAHNVLASLSSLLLRDGCEGGRGCAREPTNVYMSRLPSTTSIMPVRTLRARSRTKWNTSVNNWHTSAWAKMKARLLGLISADTKCMNVLGGMCSPIAADNAEQIHAKHHFGETVPEQPEPQRTQFVDKKARSATNKKLCVRAILVTRFPTNWVNAFLPHLIRGNRATSEFENTSKTPQIFKQRGLPFASRPARDCD